MTFGEALKLVRRNRGSSQEEFAAMIGCSRPTITRCELGTRHCQSPREILSRIYISRFLTEQERELLLLAGGWDE